MKCWTFVNDFFFVSIAGTCFVQSNSDGAKTNSELEGWFVTTFPSLFCHLITLFVLSGCFASLFFYLSSPSAGFINL